MRIEMKNQIDQIAAERERQITEEKWTAEHDDIHAGGEMALAAGCYCFAGHPKNRFSPPILWPWRLDWWKPKTKRRNLIRAAALIIAELERMQRNGE